MGNILLCFSVFLYVFVLLRRTVLRLDRSTRPRTPHCPGQAGRMAPKAADVVKHAQDT